MGNWGLILLGNIKEPYRTHQKYCSFRSFPDADFREPGAFIYSLAFFDDDCSWGRGSGIESNLRS